MIDHTAKFMARVSKHRLDKKTYIQVLDTLDLVLGKMKKDEVRAFLFSLLGKNERIMVSKRFAAIVLLERGLGLTEVSKILKLTKQTLVRLKRTQKIKNQGFNLAIAKVKKDRMAKEISSILLGLAKETADIFLNWRIKPPNDYPRK
ncbi:MAG: hypothetical protein A3C30_01275 [Candidatus Levybacteria bacterium RIFCSPHIGHO2_02_FULL_40_18]|nr:MAG: hypothetical protein A2869_00840 [Candidatus Levybacteria bacterium RIFCSPHIGHO2_01_FULL_40_58]OGH26633.1 MAG: hypothetical protein A3C30_01275 [Candidatus Levybacteria bacterium RIFCSPHIGHO2_02_FULL_40_18]OGH31162.1 MAG: hypothetical protein A3E43_00110 [Candidatus Levybacteria bacterium RIFCSPHIGHO2_12_FULL_40_31]OGH39844.1 MAG: hypothetical protein A2894_03615 [Candidatus Levybacteria bacterium RIFCSPLOWO2_01_FULL_40_64]OGH48868.1 MAG: hypothetical protein A3I54_04720 [Candidatus Lev